MKKYFLSALTIVGILAFSGVALAAGMTPNNFVETVPTVKTLDDLLKSMSGYLNTIAGTIAIIFIIIGASFYVVAAFGNKNMATLGKKIMMYAIGGFAIVAGAPVIYKEIMSILGEDVSKIATTSSIEKILLGGLKGFTYLVGLYAIIGFLIGGIAYFISFGDEQRNERAKKILKFTLIGTLIAVGSMVIAKQIVTLLSV